MSDKIAIRHTTVRPLILKRQLADFRAQTIKKRRSSTHAVAMTNGFNLKYRAVVQVPVGMPDGRRPYCTAFSAPSPVRDQSLPSIHAVVVVW